MILPFQHFLTEQELSMKIDTKKGSKGEEQCLGKGEFAPKHRQRDIGQHRFLRVILRVPIAITFAHSDRVLRFVFHFVVNLVAETVGGYRSNVCFPLSPISIDGTRGYYYIGMIIHLTMKVKCEMCSCNWTSNGC